MRGSTLLDELEEKWKENPPNLKLWNPSQIVLLQAVYLAGSRGLSESIASQLLSDHSPEQLQDFLRSAEREQVIYARKGSEFRFYGFSDFITLWWPADDNRFDRKKLEASGSLISFQPYTLRHIIYILAQSAQGQMKLTRQGQYHRRSVQIYTEACPKIISHFPESIEYEFSFFMRIARNLKLLEAKDLKVNLAKTAELTLHESHHQFYNKIITWWSQKYRTGVGAILEWLNQNSHRFYDIETLQYVVHSHCNDFSIPPLPSASKKKGLLWHQLSPVIQEMWLLGLVDFAMQEQRIMGFTVSNMSISQSEESPARLTPDFTLFLSPSVQPLSMYWAECIATRTSDEIVVPYRLSRETMLKGLAAGIPVEALLSWIAPMCSQPSTYQVIREWSESFTKTEVLKGITLLRVTDKDLWEELFRWPEFKTIITTELPYSGFIIPDDAIVKARELLSSIHLYPAVRQVAEKLVAGQDDSWDGEEKEIPQSTANTNTPPPSNTLIETSIATPPIDTEVSEITLYTQSASLISLPSKKAVSSDASTTQSDLEKKRLLEYAIVAEKMVEVSWEVRREPSIWVRPIHLLQGGGIPKVIGTDVQTGRRWEGSIDKMRFIKVIE